MRPTPGVDNRDGFFRVCGIVTVTLSLFMVGVYGLTENTFRAFLLFCYAGIYMVVHAYPSKARFWSGIGGLASIWLLVICLGGSRPIRDGGWATTINERLESPGLWNSLDNFETRLFLVIGILGILGPALRRHGIEKVGRYETK